MTVSRQLLLKLKELWSALDPHNHILMQRLDGARLVGRRPG